MSKKKPSRGNELEDIMAGIDFGTPIETPDVNNPAASSADDIMKQIAALAEVSAETTVEEIQAKINALDAIQLDKDTLGERYNEAEDALMDSAVALEQLIEAGNVEALESLAEDFEAPKIAIDHSKTEPAPEDLIDDIIAAADSETPAPAPEATGEVKTSRKKVAGGTAKAPRLNTQGMTKSAILSAKTNVGDIMKIGIDQERLEQMVAQIDKLPVKVQDKATNLMKFLSGKDYLSAYTKYCLNYLRDDGPMTVPQVVKKLTEDRGYSIGTARSQAQQISSLFRSYGIITVNNGVMELDRTNPITTHIEERLSAA